jgi:hypothetical protein
LFILFAVNDCFTNDGFTNDDLTWADFVNFIGVVSEPHEATRSPLAKIDFMTGDVFYYLTHLANGMLSARAV